MTSRERVQASLNHKQPDKVPVDFGSTGVTGVHAFAVKTLRQHLGLPDTLVKAHEPYQMLGMVEEDLQQAMGVDVEGVGRNNTLFGFPNENWKEWSFPYGQKVLVSEHFKTVDEEAGSKVIYPGGDMSVSPSGRMPKEGIFFDTIIRQEPIDDANLNVEDNLEEFSVYDENEINEIVNNVKTAAKTGRAVIANFGGTAFGDIALVPAPFLKHPKGIRDIEEWYLSTLMRQDYIHEIFTKQSDIAIQNLENLKDKIIDDVDAVFLCGTDFGTQTSTFCSVDTYRDLYMPYYKKINDWIHTNTPWKTFKHSCGAVRPLIPSLIDSGFDILNPVQCAATGMDAQELKTEFGKDLTFWGGGVDTQSTLAFGTPEEVRKQVLERCEIFSKDGGFVFNTVHNIQGNTPPENLIAMVNALKEFNGDA